MQKNWEGSVWYRLSAVKRRTILKVQFLRDNYMRECSEHTDAHPQEKTDYNDDNSQRGLVRRVLEARNRAIWWSKCQSIENLFLKQWRDVKEAVHCVYCLE